MDSKVYKNRFLGLRASAQDVVCVIDKPESMPLDVVVICGFKGGIPLDVVFALD